MEATLAVLKAMDSLAVEAAVPRMTERDFQAMRQANKNFAASVKRQDVTKVSGEHWSHLGNLITGRFDANELAN